MRTTTISNLMLAMLVLFLTACSTGRQSMNSAESQLIVGKWKVESLSISGEAVPTRLLGGDIFFQFNADGTADYTTPDGKTNSGRYLVKRKKIYDPESPKEAPVDIVSLTREQLVIAMMDEGEQLEMTLRQD